MNVDICDYPYPDINTSFTLEQVPTQDIVLDIIGLGEIEIKFDDINTKLVVFQDGEEVGEMYAGEFYDGKTKQDHNGLEVNEKLRGKGLSEIIFKIFTHQKNYGKLQIEYTRRIDSLKFLIKQGYRILSLHEECGEEIEVGTEISLEFITDLFKKEGFCKLTSK